MTHAIVLIKAAPGPLAALGGRLADLPGVRVVYSVTGAWDFVVLIQLTSHTDLAEVVSSGIRGLEGVVETTSLVAFEAYSQHDLERLFNIGGE